jgi:hypothetical protein
MSSTLREVRKLAITSGPTLVGKRFKPRPRLEVIDTVIGTAIQANEMSPANPRHGKKTEGLPVVDPIVFQTQAQHIPLLNDRPFLRLGMTQNLLALHIAR